MPLADQNWGLLFKGKTSKENPDLQKWKSLTFMNAQGIPL